MFYNSSKVANINTKQLSILSKYRRVKSDEDKVLYNSIKSEGLKDPILVVYDTKKKKYIVIDGVRRLVVLRKLKYKSVSCIVDKGYKESEWDSFEAYRDFLRISIDSKRQDLLPSQRAYYIDLLTKKYDIEYDEIAKACGVSQKQLQSWLKVADCSQEIKLWIDSRKIPVSAVNELRRLTKEGEKKFLNNFREYKRVTIEQLNQFIKTLPGNMKKVRRKTSQQGGRLAIRYKGASANTLASDLKMYETRLKEVEIETSLMRDELRYAQPLVKKILSIKELRKSLPGKLLMTFEIFAKNHGIVIEKPS